MQKALKGITSLTRKFINNPTLLLGSMALFVLIKILANPGRED